MYLKLTSWNSKELDINNINQYKVPIEQVKHTQLLGGIFDDRLEWSNHIRYIHTKIAKGV